MDSLFLKDFKERKFYQDCTNLEELDKYFKRCESDSKPAICYIGFDCTAPSLHVGSLIQIMIFRNLQKFGHKPIILLGGGTTKIGDPSGKDESRKMLTEQDIEDNKAGIKKVFERFLGAHNIEDHFDNTSNKAYILDNDEWLSGLGYINFLRDVGPHFSINRMLTFESVKRRLDRDQTLSFLEFNYMILQSYDFVKLAQEYNCCVQIGGSDQWGNIVNGMELNRRLNVEKSENFNEIYGLTTPLLTTSSGGKMGKTADGAIWLNQEMLSPYDYWQFWRNTEDADVAKFLRLFTDLSLEKISELEQKEGAEINQVKILLANEATKLCHGEEAAKMAEETAKKVFEQGGIGSDLPEVEMEKSKLENGISITTLLTEAKLTESNGEAKRLIKGGGAKINDEKISDQTLIINLSNINSDGIIKLSAGKKKHVIVKVI